jgi:Putative transposase
MGRADEIKKFMTQLTFCGPLFFERLTSPAISRACPLDESIFDEAIPGAAIVVHTFGDFQLGQAKVIYRSKDGRTSKTFEALDWLAQLVTHIPNKGEQMVRYYGYYSNKSRGLRKKAGSLCAYHIL